jgi:hypothetical protein
MAVPSRHCDVTSRMYGERPMFINEIVSSNSSVCLRISSFQTAVDFNQFLYEHVPLETVT